MSPRLQRRLWVTLAAMGAAFLGQFLVLPGIPADLAARLGPERLFPPAYLRLFEFGLSPYLLASVLLLLASGFIPELRQMREGTTADRLRFDQGIVGLTLAVALVEAVFTAMLTASQVRASVTLGPDSGALQVVGHVAAVSTLLALAWLVTRFGLGNGVVMIVTGSTLLPGVAEAVHGEAARIGQGGEGYHLPLVTLIMALVVAAEVWFLTAAARLPLVRIDESEEGGEPRRAPPALGIRLNLPGLAPLVIMGMFVLMIAFIRGRSLAPDVSPLMPGRITLLIEIAILAVSGYALVAVGYDTRHVGDLLERHGYRVRGVERADLARHLDRHIRRRLPIALVLMLAFVLLPTALAGALKSGLEVNGFHLLLIAAVVVDVVRHFRARAALDPAVQKAPDAEGEEAGTGPAAEPSDEASAPAWSEAFESDTELEAELVSHRLAERGITAVRFSDRAIPLTGTLGLWEWTVPRYPSLVFHRRLGGGRVVVLVPEADAGRAAELLGAVAPTIAPAD